MRVPAALGALALALAIPVARAQDFYQSYETGTRALQSGDCSKAAASFESAISKEAKESAKKKIYGLRFEEYFPHLMLAKAYACLGDAARAERELQASEQQGAASKSDIASVRGQLQAKATPTPSPSPSPTPTVDARMAQAKAALDAGMAAYNQKSYARAAQSFREALAADPQNADARKYLGLAQAAADKQAAVDRSLQAAERALAAKDYATARAKADDALRVDPASVAARDLMRRITTAQSAEASTPTAATPSIAEQNRQRAATELAIARQYAQSGRWDDAVVHLDMANRLDPSNVDIMQELADAQKKKGAADLLKQAADETAQARRLQADGHLSEALAHAQRALTLDSGNREARDLRDAINRQMATAARGTPPPPPTRPSPPPAIPAKEKLRDGVREFYAGRYDEALSKLAAVEGELSTLPAYHLYVGAAFLSKYILAGEQDAAMRDNAVAAFKKARSLDPTYRPDPAVLSPRILEAYQAAQ